MTVAYSSVQADDGTYFILEIWEESQVSVCLCGSGQLACRQAGNLSPPSS